MNVQNIIDRIREIIDDDTQTQLKEELNGYHVADLADIFQELKPEERLQCFKLLEIEKAADLMEYLPPQMQVELLSDIDENLASQILTQLPHDAAADVLGDMEEDESETYLDKLPHKFSEEVRELLTYNENTAGGIMNPVVLTVNSDMSVKDVLDYIRIKAEKDNMELYYVYVTDKQNHLMGVVSLRKLLTSPINQKVEDIMISDIVKLHVDDYSDFIIDEFMKYQYNALPVVDLYNRLKGMITWDDVHDLFEEETTEENNNSMISNNKNVNLNSIRKKIKKKRISKNLLRIVEILFIMVLLAIYIIILTKKLNLVNQADSIFKTLYFTYYQRTQVLYINSVVLSIHYNLVNLTDMSSLNENKEILRTLSHNLEEGFHLFYKYYLEYKEGLNEDLEELYRQRAINKITINWENEQKMTDYIKEMQIILYMAMDSSESRNYTEGDVSDCEYFLLGKFKNNVDNNITIVNGNLIRLIYYLYSNYDTIFTLFFDELTNSFENSFDKFSHNSITNFLLLEIGGLIIYILFFLINFYFIYQANKYIFQNILCLFLDFTQKENYSFNNKKDNLLIMKYINNYISLLAEFTPKKLEDLTNDIASNKELFKTQQKDEQTEKLFMTHKDEEFDKKLRDKKFNNSSKKLRSKSILKARLSISYRDNPLEESTDIHNLNNSNLSKIFLRKATNSRKTKETPPEKITRTNRTNNTTRENNQNNSSILNINNSLIDQSKSNILFGQSKNSFTSYEINDKNDLNIEKVILISKPIMIRIIKIIFIIFIVLSIAYIAFYITSIIIGFVIIQEIREMYDDFRVLVSQYNEVIHYWNNMKTLFILPNSDVTTDINNIEKFFSSINVEVLNILSGRINNYKNVKILYNYLFNSHTQEELLNANFCGDFKMCYELINSTQNILLNGLNSAVTLYEKAIYNYFQDYVKVKDIISSKEDIKFNFIKENFIILGINLNHIFSHLEEKFFRDFLEDERQIAKDYHIEIKIFSLISLFYCIILNIYSLLFIFSYINRNIEFVESSTSRIVSSFCHMKRKIQNVND